MGVIPVVMARRPPKPCRAQGNSGLVRIMVLATFLLWLSPAYGRTVIENFDNGTWDSSLFFAMQQSPLSVSVFNSDKLRVNISGSITSLFAGGLEMLGNFQFPGNFDVQVDFNLTSWPANNGVGAGIVSPLFDVRRIANNGSTSETYSFGIPGLGITNVTTTDNSGKLRLKRTGGIVQAFYWHNGAWQSIASPGTQPNKNLMAPTNVYIGVYGNGFVYSGTPLTVDFDNLTIITPPAVAPILPLMLP